MYSHRVGFFLFVSELPAYVARMRVFGDHNIIASIHGDHESRRSFCCGVYKSSCVARKKHEVAHFFYFVCTTCPSIKLTNDALRRYHVDHQLVGHQFYLVQRDAVEEFLQHLQQDEPRAVRRRFKVRNVNGVPILKCRPLQ